MTAAADLVLCDAEVHTLGAPDRTHEAVAVRDGRVARLTDDYEVQFAVDVETDVYDLDGRVVLPGFVDAHVHVLVEGRYHVHADLRGADDPGECLARLERRAAETAPGEWILGFGFDESEWGGETLTRAALDEVSDRRPVVAVREDLHGAVVNGVVLDRLGDELPDGDVLGEGLLVEAAVGRVLDAVEPGPEEAERLVRATQRAAHRRGVTGVHDMVRESAAPEVYRRMERDGELRLRVWVNYWADHLDAVRELGLRSGHGSEFVRTGAIKTFTDGSIGSHTARLAEPYADAEGERGRWVVDPDELAAVVERADAAGLQVAAHAIGDEAVGAVLDAYADCADPGGSRHRVEHFELATDEQIARLADLGAVASMQPNFHKWAGDGGLYERRLGPERRDRTNRLRAVLDAGADLAFGSDGMPFDPLFGVRHAVTAPRPAQRLDVTEALRAYTVGAAYAGFAEGEFGPLGPGRRADLVVLDRSPWEADDLRDVSVAATVVDGEAVYEDL